jgi:CCT motif
MLLTPAVVCLLQNLTYTKMIRYETRKQLAQARPRVKGQFVCVKESEAEVNYAAGKTAKLPGQVPTQPSLCSCPSSHML